MLEFPRIKYKISSLYGQVNAEIKRLLVASVGEDIGSRYFKISVLQMFNKGINWALLKLVAKY